MTSIVRRGGVDQTLFASGARSLSGTGSPEGAVTGSPGDTWQRTDGGTDTTLYRKETGVGTNTGWVASTAGGGTDLTGLGVDDRIARWNGANTIQSSAIALADNAAIAGGDIAVGVPTGVITAAGAGAFAHGQSTIDSANKGGNITAAGAGAFAHGLAGGYANMSASVAGAWVGGVSGSDSYYGGYSNIYSAAQGAFVHGRTGSGNHTVSMGTGATAVGSVVCGYVNEIGTLKANSTNGASFVFGSVIGTAVSSRILTGTGVGSFATGSVTNGGLIETTTAAGAFARGSSTGGTIRASGAGSFASGSATTGTTIVAAAGGAHALGYAINTSDILASGTGSFALGRAGNTSNILASGSGSLAFGNANSSGNIASSGNGTFAFGNIAGSANITAGAGAGAFAGGSCSTTFAITASAEGSFAFGKTDTAAIVASATNAVQFGPGTNSIANSLQVGTKWSARASGATGSGKESKTLGVGATTLAVTSSFVVVTGNGGGNTLADITGGFDGMRLVLLFVDSLVTITDTDAHTANTVDLSAAFTSADDTILELISDGTSWYEISRSVN